MILDFGGYLGSKSSQKMLQLHERTPMGVHRCMQDWGWRGCLK